MHEDFVFSEFSSKKSGKHTISEEELKELEEVEEKLREDDEDGECDK